MRICIWIAAIGIFVLIVAYGVHRASVPARFFAACKTGDTAIVRRMLADNQHLVNLRDDHGMMPLHVAAWRGHRDTVDVLLRYGANRNAPVSESTGIPCYEPATPADMAGLGGHQALAKYLDPKRKTVNSAPQNQTDGESASDAQLGDYSSEREASRSSQNLGSDDSPSPPEAHSGVRGVGETCTLVNEGASVVLAAVDHEAFNQLVKARVAKDKDGFNQLVNEGKVVGIPVSTKALVIDINVLGAEQVRVREGTYAGKAYWVYAENCK